MKFLLDLTEPKIMALMIAVLFFLLALLINFLQYHHYKRRTDRFIQKEESLLHFLIRFSKIIKKIETTCTYEMEVTTSLKDIGNSLHSARNLISSSINDILGNLRSFREYRAKEKNIGKHMKQINTQSKKPTSSVTYRK